MTKLYELFLRPTPARQSILACFCVCVLFIGTARAQSWIPSPTPTWNPNLNISVRITWDNKGYYPAELPYLIYVDGTLVASGVTSSYGYGYVQIPKPSNDSVIKVTADNYIQYAMCGLADPSYGGPLQSRTQNYRGQDRISFAIFNQCRSGAVFG
jgi:hypothetical protein